MSLLLPPNKPRDIKKSLTQKIYLYGDPYCGKTTFASEFDDPFIISTDGNYKFLTTPAVTVTCIQDLDDIVAELEKGEHDFKTIIVDVIDHVAEMYRSEILKENNVVDEQDLGAYGKGYNMVREPFRTFVKRISRLEGVNVIFIGHSETIVETDRLYRETTVTRPKMTGKLSDFVSGLVDYTFFMNIEQEAHPTEENMTVKKHYIHLNAIDENQKGGSRVAFSQDKIEADYDKFSQMVSEAIDNIGKEVVTEIKAEEKPEKKASKKKDLDKKLEKKPKLGKLEINKEK